MRQSPLHQAFVRSLRAEGVLPSVVVSNDSAADWLIRVGPIAAQLNRESQHDPKDAA